MLPFLSDYWSSESLLGVLGISAGLPIDRFKALLQCFHLNGITKAVPRNRPGHDQLHKIRPMVECLLEMWRFCYHPPHEQSIAEALVGFKGRSAIEQYMPMKPTKRGYKVLFRCSPNGMTTDCKVNEGSASLGRQT